MHKELYIVKGIPKTTETSQEAGVSPLSLMNETAFSLKSDGWTPQIAQFSGTWKESNLTNGRELIAGKDQNVIENLQLGLAADTHEQLYERLKVLNRLVEDAQLFHTVNYQLEPVYLKWWAECGAGYQYALIYAIDVVPALVDLNQTPTIDVSLTIEREPYWRPIPPGANPRLWTNYWRNLSPTHEDDGLTLVVSDDNRSLFNEKVTNTTVVLNNTTDHTVCEASYIDIAATDIPGDAPALLELSFDGTYQRLSPPSGTAGAIQRMHIARYSRPLTAQDNTGGVNDGLTLRHTNTLHPGSVNLGSALGGTDTTVVSDNGAIASGGTCCGVGDPWDSCSGAGTPPAQSRFLVTFATLATNAARIRWALDPSLFSGRYAVFMRANQSAGSVGDIGVYLQYGYAGIDRRTDTINPAVNTTATPLEFYAVNYMGTIDIPTDNADLNVSIEGYGRQDTASISRFLIDLYAARTTGAGELRILDLVLMPIDEGGIDIDFSGMTDGASGNDVFYDNTGYFGHGKPDDVVFARDSTSIGKTPELKGNGIEIVPGVTNRLYFFSESSIGGTFQAGVSSVVGNPSSADRTMVRTHVVGNVVPRWAGVRDV